MAAAQDLIAGRYRIIRHLQRIGETDYFAALDITTNQPVTLRTIDTAEQGRVGIGLEHLAASKLRRMMENEARLLQHLNHPGLLKILASGFDDPIYYHVYAPFHFYTLQQAILEQGYIPYPQLLDYALQAATTLAALHDADIIHCDISPETLLLLGVQVKIIEFAITNHEVSKGVATGNPLYMSPEAIAGAHPAPQRDVWALGATLYYALTGQPPFGNLEAPREQGVMRLFQRILHEEPQPISELAADFPPAFIQVIAQMLHKDPALRIRSMADILSALQTLR